MESLKIIVFLASIVALTQAQGCNLNQQEMTKIALTCGERNPFLMLQLAEHMKNPDELANVKFVCGNEAAIVDTYLCIIDKLKGCIPAEFQPYMEILPNKARASKGLSFMCQHKEVAKNKCIMEVFQPAMECYKGRIGQMMTTMGAKPNPKELICKVIRSEEQCFAENKGSCSDDFMKLFFEAIENFYPVSDCPESTKTNGTSKLLRALLLRGKPMLDYQGNFDKPYVIKN